MVLCAGIGGCIWLNILPMICENNAIGAAFGIFTCCHDFISYIGVFRRSILSDSG